MADQEDEWRQRLTSEQYDILRRARTEPAHTGKLLDNKEPGVYFCGACEKPLFKSEHKYDSGSGWPSFYQPAESSAVATYLDASLGLVRMAILCNSCQSHLGHVFDDSPQTPTGERYCVNSLALKFKGRDGKMVSG